MATLAEIVARAEQIAIARGTDPHQSPVIDAGMTVEALYPHALRYAIKKDLENGGSAENYRRSFFIPIIDGKGEFPENAFPEYMCLSYLPDFPKAAYVPLPDMQGQRYDNLLVYYALQGSTLHTTAVLDAVLSTIQAASDPTTTWLTASGINSYFPVTSVGKAISLDGSVKAIISSLSTGNTVANIYGKPLGLDDYDSFITETKYDRVVKTVTGAVDITADTNTPTGLGLSAEDIGARVRIASGGTVTIDAYVSDTSTPTLTANAISTVTFADAEILRPHLEVSTPGIPDTPVSPTADAGISDRLVNDVILVMAAAVTGELKLKEMLDYKRTK